MFRPTLIGIVALLGFATGTAAAERAGVDLAKLAGWDIVVAPDASPSETYAADEFRSVFAQATGIELAKVTAPDRADRHVFIGASKSLAGSSVGFDATAMGQESLRIVVRDNLIAIAGGRPRGTLYGVYTFLEDYLHLELQHQLQQLPVAVPKPPSDRTERPLLRGPRRKRHLHAGRGQLDRRRAVGPAQLRDGQPAVGPEPQRPATGR
jgi:hypothetical protein